MLRFIRDKKKMQEGQLKGFKKKRKKKKADKNSLNRKSHHISLCTTCITLTNTYRNIIAKSEITSNEKVLLILQLFQKLSGVYWCSFRPEKTCKDQESYQRNSKQVLK